MPALDPNAAPLLKLVAQGNNQGLKLVKTLLQSPMLINPPAGMPYSYENQAMLPFVIPLETENHKQHLDAEVSESLIISKTEKVNVTDNVAPGSWSWQLSGYIPGIPELEPSNLFTPFVAMMTNYLKRAAAKGFLMVYKDIDAAIYTNVVIKSIDIDTQKDCRNRTPFTMTLKAINTLDELTIDSTAAEAAAATEAGTALGEVLKVGVTTGVKILSSLTDLFILKF